VADSFDARVVGFLALLIRIKSDNCTDQIGSLGCSGGRVSACRFFFVFLEKNSVLTIVDVLGAEQPSDPM